MNSKIGLIVKREYFERVKKKSFIITTLLMPIFMVGLMGLPAFLMMMDSGSKTEIAVVDQSGLMVPLLESGDNLVFKVYPSDSLEAARGDEKVDAILFIPDTILSKDAGVQLYTNGASSLSTEQELRGQLNRGIEKLRIANYDIPELDKIMESVTADVNVVNYRNDKEDAEESSTMLSYGLGVGLTFLLYMCLLLYGQMVMTSIIEEKNNRVLEIVVSSVKPTQLMMGKILGICLVVVTQIVIWGVLMSLMSAFMLPVLMDEVTAEAGVAGVDNGLLAVAGTLGNVSYIMELFGLLLLFLIGGFLLYAAVYAAIGSAVDNIQDASQLQTIVVIPIVLGIAVGMAAATDPNSAIALWGSFIPFTSPMVMMARIPFGIPGWQIAVSVAILYLSFLATVWVAAKIYRIGIFMYGKKPSVKELVRWAKIK